MKKVIAILLSAFMAAALCSCSPTNTETMTSAQEALEKGDKVSITGFGTFEVRERGEKTCINPKTKAKMVCPPCKAPAFKAGRGLKDAVNK